MNDLEGKTKGLAQEMERLTKSLVSIASVNGSKGEQEVAELIEQYLRAFPYFKEHKEQIIVPELKEDLLHRKNVFAYIKGTKSKSNRTLLFHGHMDTVGVEDFGKLMPEAFSCDKLLEEMLEMELPETVRKDLESGDYMVGRGACDMKSGVAVFLVLLHYLSEHLDTFSGNIVFSANPVEENLHTGIIEGLDILEMLQEKEGFCYELAINNDYICPLYEGDTKRYIYTGAVGKLLPCFYIQGKETHVGQCFEGFDASLAAAELVRAISLNTEFCDVYNQESTLPPSVLKIKDCKTQYNVQTAFDAFAYFNYFVHNKSMEEIICGLKAAAESAFSRVEDRINEQNERYCSISGDAFHKVAYEKKVVTFEELKQAVVQELEEQQLKSCESMAEEQQFKTCESISEAKSWNANEILDAQLGEIVKLEREKGLDVREIGMRQICYMLDVLGEKQPVIVLCFAPPYCPHNTLKKEVPEEAELQERLQKIAEQVGEETGEIYEVKQFFPSLSDSSYLKIDDSEESIDMLVDNFPGYHMLYPLPLKQIKRLHIPAVNFGVYGKDAHKWTERLYKPYSFEVLPKLILAAVEEFLA